MIDTTCFKFKVLLYKLNILDIAGINVYKKMTSLMSSQNN